jgi:hypothetical protein
VREFKRVQLDSIVQISKGPIGDGEKNQDNYHGLSLTYTGNNEENRVSGSIIGGLWRQTSDEEKTDVLRIVSTETESSHDIVERIVTRLSNFCFQQANKQVRDDFIVDAQQLDKKSFLQKTAGWLQGSLSNKPTQPNYLTREEDTRL